MEARAWSIEYHIREDEDSMFLPAELIPDAEPGDIVEVTSSEPSIRRRGQITGPPVSDARGEFFTVRFDAEET